MKILTQSALIFIFVLLLSACSSPKETVADYLNKYGGSEQVYFDISISTDCQFLQETFDQAYEGNQRYETGSNGSKWTLGYMTASDARMKEIGCYDK